VNQYLPYLWELRTRLLRGMLVFFVLFLILFWQDASLYKILANPLLKHLPTGASLVATEVTSPFTIPLKLALISAFFLAVPYFFYQLWSFITPALYRREKHLFLPILIGSICLFYMGALFSYFVICPLALKFFILNAPSYISIMTDIRHYLDFILSLLLAGGLSFQVPVITFILIRLEWVSIEKLTYLRPYIIVGAFVVAMFLTPPDVVSQTLVAIPMWLLFEAGLLAAKWFKVN